LRSYDLSHQGFDDSEDSPEIFFPCTFYHPGHFLSEYFFDQQEIAKQITELGGDYVLDLKGSHGTLHKNEKQA